MKLFRTIRTRLFVAYGSIVLVLVCLFAVYFYRYTADILEKRAAESLQQLAINANQYLDAEFKNMNSLANLIISSEPIKEVYYDKAAMGTQLLENQWKLYQLLFTVTGSSLNYQINLVGTDGSFTEFGRTFDIGRRDPRFIAALPWVTDCLLLDGRYSISPPRVNEWNSRSEQVISLNRAFSEVFGGKYDSLVEVQQRYEVFAGLIENAISLPDNRSNQGVFAYAYDSAGRQVYPFPEKETAPAFNYYSAAQAAATPYGTFPVLGGGATEIVAFATSEYSGWTVIVCEPEKQLLAPVRAFRNGILSLGAVVLLVTLAITYMIAKQLTEPIRSLRHSISRLNLGDLHTDGASVQKNSTDELVQLGSAYSQMVSRLQASLDETVTAKSHEVQAQMLALQAQMNPHFLYNTITILSIKAENNGQTEIVEMCESLTAMLRYIAKDSSAAVTLGVELNYLQKYLSLMEVRYPGQFSVSVKIPEPMKAIAVPKLILQPIIENCFKYAFNIRAPWLVRVEGALCDGLWSITVTDNGVGFDPQVLEALSQKMNAAAFEFATEEKDKIGLLNIYYRLKLRYRERAVFQIMNNPEGGSTVVIGGAAEEGKLK